MSHVTAIFGHSQHRLAHPVTLKVLTVKCLSNSHYFYPQTGLQCCMVYGLVCMMLGVTEHQGELGLEVQHGFLWANIPEATNCCLPNALLCLP